jgi:hypothetical protein
MGFTDHDRDIGVDGVTYEAQAGFTASEIESSLGLSVDNLDAGGALSSERLDAARLKAGDFDNASVEVWRVTGLSNPESVRFDVRICRGLWPLRPRGTPDMCASRTRFTSISGPAGASQHRVRVGPEGI